MHAHALWSAAVQGVLCMYSQRLRYMDMCECEGVHRVWAHSQCTSLLVNVFWDMMVCYAVKLEWLSGQQGAGL